MTGDSQAVGSELTLASLKRIMRDRGVQKLYVKILAANDNSRNQPYFGPDITSLHILPGGVPKAVLGKGGKWIFHIPLQFAWIDDDGAMHPAPIAKLIVYPQYPEVRLSGYLKGSHGGPSELMGKTRVPGRLLFLGVREDDVVLGYASSPDSQLAKEVQSLVPLEQVGVFLRIPFGIPSGAESRTALLTELCRISHAGWIDSWQLGRGGVRKPCKAQNCGGYTLEAELGIEKNSRAEPDFQGWEVKGHSVSNFQTYSGGAITLMTPEPHAGFYKDHGVFNFVTEFGYQDKRGRSDRWNFGGIHRSGVECRPTGLTMTLNGFDATTSRITDSRGDISLVDKDGRPAATWWFTEMMAHWNKKHANAAYVPYMKGRIIPLQFQYAAHVRLAIGTDFTKLLTAIARGHVYYDPGIKIENYSTDPTSKKRSQFRINSRSLGTLYSNIETVDVCRTE